MEPGLDTLKKVLVQERALGFQDKAMIGGLDAFLERWRDGESGGISIPDSYKGLGVQERRKWVEGALATMGKAPGVGQGAAVRASRPRQGKKAPVKARPESAVETPEPDDPVTTLKGVQDATAKRLAKLGVETVRDLIYLFPNRHLDFRATNPIAELKPGEEQTATGFVWEASVVRLGPRRQGSEAILGDESGNIKIVWFNNTYIGHSLKPNHRIAVSGKVRVFRGRKVFENPEYEIISDKSSTHTGRLVPVYPLTEGLYQRTLRNLVHRTLELCLEKVPEFLDDSLLKRRGLMPIKEAIDRAHFPEDEEAKEGARVRLAFNELLMMQLRVLARKMEWQLGQEARPITEDEGLRRRFVESLPFRLTGAQTRAMGEVLGDMGGTKPMARLLQGDVGSGKTVVAAGALLQAVSRGAQGALMAPTEILAEQHFGTICELLGDEGGALSGNDVVRGVGSRVGMEIRVGLLIGDIRQGMKREVHREAREGAIDIVVGTQALIQNDVEFRDLGLIVVDEQHRFGVMQRAALREKGSSPHLLVMTATPIPRTLALTLYGDLDVSLLDEMPPGRIPIETKQVKPYQRKLAYDFVKLQVQKGRQAFVICPLVEESESLQTRAATKEYERLSEEVFPDLRLGLLHGRLNSVEKDEEMERFRQGETDILVSTAVVEVGIDIPNATVMMIEGAERFGLSQLHQFRGRVGRGREKSYCLLLTDNASEEAGERLKLMAEIGDGFKLAEEDLRLRGPGEFFGTRQSGLPDLRMARLTDTKLLNMAREEAEKTMESDPFLEEPGHRALAIEMQRLGAGWSIGGNEA